MAKTREQVLQEQLGLMAFNIAILTADLDAAREEIAALKAKIPDNMNTSRVHVEGRP